MSTRAHSTSDHAGHAGPDVRETERALAGQGVSTTHADTTHHPGRITAGELVLVCSHYDLGDIRTVRKLPGGSRNSPKVLLVGGSGGRSAFLLKRRAPGAASDPALVALTHEIILHLEGAGLPAPRLIGTRDDNNSMLQLVGTDSESEGGARGPSRVYEVYRYVRGRGYARTPGDALAAGALLARVHRELAGFATRWPIPGGSYHARAEVATSLENLARRQPEIADVCRSLAARYTFASHKAREAGVDGLRRQLVHSDWHPGNLVYKRPDPSMPAVSHVAAILDFDSVRSAPTLLDAANGAMQFSIGKHSADGVGVGAEALASLSEAGGPPRQWHMSLNPQLFEAFWSGYHRGSATASLGRSGPAGSGLVGSGPAGATSPAAVGGVADRPLMRAVPWLMIQALVVEALVPIAHTGRFERLEAEPILRMVDRACAKFQVAGDELVRLASKG